MRNNNAYRHQLTKFEVAIIVAAWLAILVAADAIVLVILHLSLVVAH